MSAARVAGCGILEAEKNRGAVEYWVKAMPSSGCQLSDKAFWSNNASTLDCQYISECRILVFSPFIFGLNPSGEGDSIDVVDALLGYLTNSNRQFALQAHRGHRHCLSQRRC